MTNTAAQANFGGPVSEVYENYLVPMIFDPYANDLVNRLLAQKPMRILEIAAGTGAVTRAMALGLPATTEIVATDLNQGMLDQAMAKGTSRSVEWRIADALELPFENETFDCVVCQFGVMFFPDKAKGFSEALRVLKPGGRYIFNVWDTLNDNDFANVVHTTVVSLFPENPPNFLARAPYGYNNAVTIQEALTKAGFEKPAQFEAVAARGKVSAAKDVAIGYCQGTPLRNEISAFGPTKLTEVTDRVEQDIVKQFGPGPIDSKIQAVVITVTK